jgi:hypothetical protein
VITFVVWPSLSLSTSVPGSPSRITIEAAVPVTEPAPSASTPATSVSVTDCAVSAVAGSVSTRCRGRGPWANKLDGQPQDHRWPGGTMSGCQVSSGAAEMLAVSDWAMPAQNNNHPAALTQRLSCSALSTPAFANTSSPSTHSANIVAPAGSDHPPGRTHADADTTRTTPANTSVHARRTHSSAGTRTRSRVTSVIAPIRRRRPDRDGGAGSRPWWNEQLPAVRFRADAVRSWPGRLGVMTQQKHRSTDQRCVSAALSDTTNGSCAHGHRTATHLTRPHPT